jgi:hypothetical protein
MSARHQNQSQRRQVQTRRSVRRLEIGQKDHLKGRVVRVVEERVIIKEIRSAQHGGKHNENRCYYLVVLLF